MKHAAISRKPTKAEYEQLYELLDDLSYYVVEDKEARHSDINTALEEAIILVIEGLETRNSRYSGKMVLVVWADHSTNNYDLFSWNNEGQLEEVEQIK